MTLLEHAGLFAHLSGELSLSLSFYGRAANMHRLSCSMHSLCFNLMEQALVLLNLGKLLEAEKMAQESVSLGQRGFEENLRDPLACLATALALQGRIQEALTTFREATVLEKRIHWPHGDEIELYSLRGVLCADFLLRLGRAADARRMTEKNLAMSREEGWPDDVARCHWILGRVDTAEQHQEDAVEHLATAEGTFRRAQIISYLPRVLLARAELEWQQQRWDEAAAAVDEALGLAAVHEMQLDHADALALRARLIIDRAHITGKISEAVARAAQDDAQEATCIARGCGYAWAERDALSILAHACDVLGDHAAASRHRADSVALCARLADPEP